MDFHQLFNFTDAWSASPDDLIDSLFSNGAFLQDLDYSDNLHFNEDLPSDLTSTTDSRISPVSSVEPEFHGFLDAVKDEQETHDITQYVNFSQNSSILCSSSSDSGLSSDNMEIDPSPDYEPHSPALSSPGPSISERGGKNSPARSTVTTVILPPQSTTKPAIVNSKVTPKTVSPKSIPFEYTPVSIKDVNIRQPQNKVKPIIQKNELKIYKISPAGTSGVPTKRVTLQMSSTPNKVQQSPGTFVINKKPGQFSGVRKLVRVQNPSNPRSILLPVSFQDVKDFRTIKIINTSNMNTKSANIKLAAANLLQQSKQGLVQKNVLFSKEQLIDDSMSDQTSDAESYVFEDVMLQGSNSSANATDAGHQSDSSDSTHHNSASSYPKLLLTNEEKRLLDKEGIALPGNYPLTKHEERELKRIRRKIRNKISAQDSRKRKKEYVDGLEERVKQCTDENQTLIKRLKLLQSQHNNLTNQVKKLQAMLSKGTNKTAQPATCLMVLLLSLALVTIPNLKLGQNAKDTELADALEQNLLQNRRNLLFDTKEQFGDVLVDEEMNLDDILAYNDIDDQELSEDDRMSSVSASKKPKHFVEFDVDDKVWRPPLTMKRENVEFNGKASAYQEELQKSEMKSINILSTNVKLEPDVIRMDPFNAAGKLFNVGLDNFVIFANTADQNNNIQTGNERKVNTSSKVNIEERRILMKGA